MAAGSSEIESLRDALDYYAGLVGDHQITVAGRSITIRFAFEEIHPFTEAPKPGRRAPESMLVYRPGRTGEVRVFSRQRARLLDKILPTLTSPAGCVAGKMPRSLMVFGPCDSVGARIAVIICPDSDGAFTVRTAYSIDMKEFGTLTRSGRNRRLPWPPK